jgi:hypothetical protein
MIMLSDSLESVGRCEGCNEEIYGTYRRIDTEEKILVHDNKDCVYALVEMYSLCKKVGE